MLHLSMVNIYFDAGTLTTVDLTPKINTIKTKKLDHIFDKFI